MKTAHVRPLGGRKLRLPDRPSQIMPAEGLVVAINDYWQARIETGDAEIVTKPPPAPRRAKPKPQNPPQED